LGDTPADFGLTTQGLSFFHWRVGGFLVEVDADDGAITTSDSSTSIKGHDLILNPEGPFDTSTEQESGQRFPGGWNRQHSWGVAPDFYWGLQFLCPSRRYMPAGLDAEGNPTWFIERQISVNVNATGFISDFFPGAVAAGTWTINGEDPITGLDFTQSGTMWVSPVAVGATCSIVFTPNSFYDWDGKYNTLTGELN
jgi:hypothetical protein